MACEEPFYDRQRELDAFDDTKAGVKGLFDSGMKTIPQIFIKKNQEIDQSSDTNDSDYSIPVIDLQGLHGDEKSRSEIVNKVRDACENWGFFQVINHGIGVSTLDGILEGVRKFHEQESAVKKSLYSRGSDKKVTFYCNYNLFNSPVTDWRDTLSFSMAPDPPEPEELPTICRDITIDYSNQVKSLGSTLFELASLALGLDPSHLKAMDIAKKLMVYGLYYPPCPQPDLTMGTSKHTDTNSLTILLQDQVSGLQILHQDKWVDVVPVHGALIVNLGDLMQLITNDKFKSVIHRVVLRKTGSPRVSVACFFGPQGNNRVYGPMKELLSEENPPVYKEVTMEQVNNHYATKGVDKAFSVKHFKVVK